MGWRDTEINKLLTAAGITDRTHAPASDAGSARKAGIRQAITAERDHHEDPAMACARARTVEAIETYEQAVERPFPGDQDAQIRESRAAVCTDPA
jgi:hypothetical protein